MSNEERPATINLQPSRESYERRILPALKEAEANLQHKYKVLLALRNHPVNLTDTWLAVYLEAIEAKLDEVGKDLTEIQEEINNIEIWLKETSP